MGSQRAQGEAPSWPVGWAPAPAVGGFGSPAQLLAAAPNGLLDRCLPVVVAAAEGRCKWNQVSEVWWPCQSWVGAAARAGLPCCQPTGQPDRCKRPRTHTTAPGPHLNSLFFFWLVKPCTTPMATLSRNMKICRVGEKRQVHGQAGWGCRGWAEAGARPGGVGLQRGACRWEGQP